MKITILIFLLILMCSGIKSQNPICPIGYYIADPTARVWEDGNMYVYGSTDDGLDHWCSHKYDVLFSEDLGLWNIVENIFATRGEFDAVKETDAFLFAPDIAYRNKKYYLYFCTPDERYSEGVAVSSSPFGKFNDACKLKTSIYNQIDPTIFVDEDGQAYYYWGQGSLKCTKMDDSMMKIDSTSIIDNIITKEEHFFHEGAFVFKRNGIYYIVYADESRHGNSPTCLGYATSNSPVGPFKYRGVIIDNFGCDPKNWNNHGSVAEYKGQWYVFYHRSSHNSKVMRRACIEPIFFNNDGTIDEVEMTSQGAGKPIDAFVKIDAERACLLSGTCFIQLIEPHNEAICGVKNGDGVTYKYIDFSRNASMFTARVCPNQKAKINIRLNDSTGAIIGCLNITEGRTNDYISLSCPIKYTSGVHALYLEFIGGEGDLFSLDSFYFQ